MKAIDPTEIIIDGQGTIREKTTSVSPWVRLWARVFDYSLFSCMLWLVHATTGVDLVVKEMLVPFEYLLWIPVETLLLLTIGVTPGKWLLRTEIRQGRRRRFEPKAALRRSFQVWLRGIGLGIPVVNFICMLMSYQQLMVRKLSSWDMQDHVHIVHHPVSALRMRIVGGLAAVGLVLYHIYGA